MHSIKDALGDRMKEYEYVSRTYLTKKIPVVIRIDGKAFHTFTKGFVRPFDTLFMETMQETMKCLCEGIQGCVIGYTQSDEITLVLTDYASAKTESWFGYNVQKMTSIASSMATLNFNRIFKTKLKFFENESTSEHKDLLNAYNIAYNKGAMFDARVFSLPKEEVINCLIWRQQDATRNSILSVAQHYFSHKEVMNKKCNELQDKLMLEKGINWNDYSTSEKRGTCCIKVPVEVGRDVGGDVTAIITRNKWVIDEDIPIFTQNRYYIESRL